MQSNNQIQHVSFIGSGNVANHLALGVKNAGLTISEIYSPTSAHRLHLAEVTGARAVNEIAELSAKIDLCVICVPDDKVKMVSGQLRVTEGIVVHTSGITSIDVFKKAKRYGVLYPLQTFSKNKALELKDVPFCVEGNNEKTTNQLIEFARRLSQNVHLINSEERRYLHLTAVMVNNFTNHLYHVAEDILKSKDIDFNLLLPLIKETAGKIEFLAPGKAQTGPAKRNDTSTVDVHSDMLKHLPEYRELYQLISKQIKKKYHG